MLVKNYKIEITFVSLAWGEEEAVISSIKKDIDESNGKIRKCCLLKIYIQRRSRLKKEQDYQKI